MDFSRIAPFYDLLLFLGSGKSIRRARNLYLSEIIQAKDLLIIGGGTGAFLLDLIKAGYAGRVVYLDPSPAMLRLARKKIRRQRQKTNFPAEVHFLNQSLETFANAMGNSPKDMGDGHQSASLGALEKSKRQSLQKFSAIAVFFFLDLFETEELEKQIEFIEKVSLPGVRLYLADFFLSPAAPLWQKISMQILYIFFGVLGGVPARRLGDWQGCLRKRGWGLLREGSSLGGFLRSRIYEKKSRIAAIR